MNKEQQIKEAFKKRFGDYPEYSTGSDCPIYEQGYCDGENAAGRRYASQVEGLKVENERLREALNGIRDKVYSLNIPYELYKDNKWVRGLHTEINGIIDAATDALKPKEEQ